MVAGAASAKVAAGAGQEISSAEVAAGAPSVEVAADAYPADNQDPEADGWLNTVQHLLTQRAPPKSVGQRPQQHDPTEAERMAQGWCDEGCVRGRGGCVRGRGQAACEDVAGISLTEGGRTRTRDTQYESFNATISSSTW